MKKLLVLMTLYGCGSDSGVTSVPVLPTPTTTPLKGENDDKTTTVVASEITTKASDKTDTSAVVAEKEKNSGKADDVDSDAPASTQSSSSSSLKLTDPSCVDPDLTKVSITERFMNCRGEFVNGTMEDPTPTPAVTITPAALPECTGNGQVGCVSTSTYKSANLSNLSTDNIRSGVEIAGVTGNLAVFAEPHSSCTDNGQTGCIATSTYKSANLTNVVAANIRSGVNAAGVVGTLTVSGESHTDCSGNDQVGCVTTATYKSADTTNLIAANIKASINIAGVVGQYPSSTYPLNGAASNVADLNDATFNAKIKSASSFEWFDSAGSRYTATGSSYISEANIRADVNIFGTTGTFALVAPNAWDVREGVVVNGTTGLSRMTCRDDTSEASVTCNTASWATHVTVDSHTVYTDRLTGLEWLMVASSPVNRASAYNVCAGLASSDDPNWRLPSLAEIKQALLHKMRSITPMGNYFNTSGNQQVWSSVTAGNWTLVVSPVIADTSVANTDTTTIGFCVK